MKQILCLSMLILICSCQEQKAQETAPTKVEPSTSSIEIVDYNGLEAILGANDDVTYVVNFWATWCKPCIKELPAFEALNEAYANEKVEVILVSLDFKKQVEGQLLPFLEKKEIASRVILMDDPKENEWVPKVSKHWSGAIPATLIKKGNEHSFYEQSFDYAELERALNTVRK